MIPSSGYRIPCVVLKLEPNAKNWLTKKKTMMVGIDVTHPGPSSWKGIPPIAAVVASMTTSSSSRLAYVSSSITRKRYVSSDNYAHINRCSTNSGICWFSACLFTKRRTKWFQREFLLIAMAVQRQVLVTPGGTPLIVNAGPI